MTITKALSRGARCGLLALALCMPISAAALPAAGNLTPVGKSQVATPGTPVSILNQYTYTGSVYARSVLIQAAPTNVGNIYVVVGPGAADLVNYSNVIAIVTAGSPVTVTLGMFAYGVLASNLYIDAGSANDKAICTLIDWSIR